MEKEFFCTKTEPSVKTPSGYVRGYRLDGTYTFLGIPYGQAKRFMMPEAPTPWEGYFDATVPGYNCPALTHTQAKDGFPHNFWLENEDCLNLNVWTPTLDRSAKKAVVVWLHGGAFTYGAPLRQPAYDGYNLAHKKDVVVVSIANRLNLFGFMDLSAFGEKYHNSGNAGVADIVFAMKWIHENIENFGGDPENVTICGQSGGGMKVFCLMQCPEAAGTFSKAVIMSGTFGGSLSIGQDSMYETAKAMLRALGKPEDDPTPLEELPTAELIRLYKSVLSELKAAGVSLAFGPKSNDYFDGRPTDSYPDFEFCERAKKIPVVIGSTFTEMNLSANMPDKDHMTEAEMTDKLRTLFGDDTDHLIELFKKAYPRKSILDLGYLDAMVRNGVYRFCDKRARTCTADTWAYILTPEIAFNGGVPTWHSADLAWLFCNTETTPIANIPGASDRIEEQFSGMWVEFAKNGDPSNSAFSETWRPYTAEDPAVMHIDINSEVKKDFDRELVGIIGKKHGNLLKDNMAKRPTMVGI